MSPSVEQVKDEGTRAQVILAGGFAGLISRFCIAPLDVVKIRLQLQPHSLSDPLSCDGIKGPTYKGALHTMRAIAKQEGIRALWKGNIPAELMYVCYGGMQFVAYRGFTQMQQALPVKMPSSAESFVSGASAGALATTITYPLDLLRTRFAAQGTDRIYTGLLGAVKDIARDEGPRGYFRGLSAAVGTIVPYMGLFFSSYELFHQHLGGKNLPLSSGDAVAGVLASVLAKTATFPFDLVRKRLQVQGPMRTRYVHTNIPIYAGVWRGLHSIWRKEGVRGWYRGLTVSLIKAAPASAITMYVYERSLHVLMAERNDDNLWECYDAYADDYDD
ncbi:mitochondrial thiamine pyrophosphate carrier 1 [Cyphellophora europaea CBS 101466]|uniref:Mitochondrial thiamine pyrophosphate carrier 1 n=1 Tax=Cyphellophora europaea (strain CBS 101466) TaxID=1220924 RepID=W2RLT4_CYPE1|nr:mitochondrial thiamine pyrophosphate carrier 1 [Cyphellophora europaea CBS 101466]ETN37275.1 mitochondrial thiamine pyrophosphate carrier 1 [Cyphellophora europaea CBS 101466]